MATSPVMTMLEHGVPITLLCDLVALGDPQSEAINSAERPANDPIWLDAARTLAKRHQAVTA